MPAQKSSPSDAPGQPVESGAHSSVADANAYVLVLGDQQIGSVELQKLLWKHGIPVYIPSERMPLDMIQAELGHPSLIVLYLEAMETAAMIEVEEYRLRHQIPSLCISPADLQQPRFQGSLQVCNDFICAPFDGPELLMRIARIRRQGQPRVHPRARLRLIANKRQFRSGDYTVVLSPIEYAILHQLNERGGQAVSFHVLCDHIEGKTVEQRLSTLRVHVRRLRQKIEPYPRRPQYVQTVRGIGYRLSEPITVDETS